MTPASRRARVHQALAREQVFARWRRLVELMLTRRRYRLVRSLRRLQHGGRYLCLRWWAFATSLVEIKRKQTALRRRLRHLWQNPVRVATFVPAQALIMASPNLSQNEKLLYPPQPAGMTRPVLFNFVLTDPDNIAGYVLSDSWPNGECTLISVVCRTARGKKEPLMCV